MDSISTSQEYEKELTRIFNRFNKHFWNNELPEVIITFVPTKKAHGHMSSVPTWHADGSESKYELNISAYTISRSPEEICATLLHEQVHLYCNIKDIKDTSSDHRYHNKNFKRVAEDHGLNVDRRQDGWSLTTLDDKAKAYFKKLNIKKFSYHKDYRWKGGNLKRFSCPRCHGPSVFAATKQSVLCSRCKIPLVYMPKE